MDTACLTCLQVFEHSYGRTFRAIFGQKATLQVNTLAHIDSNTFLWLLPWAPAFNTHGEKFIELNTEAYAIFQSLQKHRNALAEAVKELGRLRRGRKKV